MDGPEHPFEHPAEQPPVTASGRPRRERFLPAAFRDFVPTQPSLQFPTRTRDGFIPPPPASISSTSPERSLSPDILPPTLLHTESDSFGLFREYTEYPTYEPDKYTSLDDVCDAGTFNTAPAPSRDPESGFGPRKAPQSSSSQFPSSSDSAQNPYAPFPNPSTYHMMKFAYDCQNDNSFRLAGIQRMNDQVIQQPDFDPTELSGFSAHKEAKRLDEFISSQSFDSVLPFDAHAGWKKASVKVSLPCTRHKTSEDKAPTVEIDDVVHRDLLEVMKETYSSEAASEYHLRGYKQMWEREGYPEPIRVHGEVYSSDTYGEGGTSGSSRAGL